MGAARGGAGLALLVRRENAWQLVRLGLPSRHRHSMALSMRCVLLPTRPPAAAMLCCRTRTHSHSHSESLRSEIAPPIVKLERRGGCSLPAMERREKAKEPAAAAAASTRACPQRPVTSSACCRQRFRDGELKPLPLLPLLQVCAPALGRCCRGGGPALPAGQGARPFFSPFLHILSCEHGARPPAAAAFSDQFSTATYCHLSARPPLWLLPPRPSYYML